MKLSLNKNSDIPIYKQVVEEIVSEIHNGFLLSGNKLPSERELSEQLDVSRGTITKAYNELANLEVVTLVKGKGCFVTDEKSFLSQSRKEKAVQIIKNSIGSLEDLGFSLSEIRIFSEIVLMEKDKNYSNIRIGIIDCNREALHAIHCQIGTIKEISISKYMLDDINSKVLQSDILSNDLIITTYTHYLDVLQVLPSIEDRLVRVAMSPSKKTLVELGRVSINKSIGILYDSEKFLKVIKNELEVSEIEFDNVEAHALGNYNKEIITKFVKNKEIIIIPPLIFFDTAFRRFLMMRLNNQQIIEFNYLIERGNLLYLEEKIRNLMVRK